MPATESLPESEYKAGAGIPAPRLRGAEKDGVTEPLRGSLWHRRLRVPHLMGKQSLLC